MSPGRPQLSGDLPETPTLAAAWTASGDLALFDVQTGAVVSQAAGGGLGGEVDLACDPWHSRVLVFEGDAEDVWGEIASYETTAQDSSLIAALGPREHQVWIDGVARVAPSPSGIVVFEDGYGPRWRLLREDGVPSPAAIAPRPASIALSFEDDGGDEPFAVSALTYGPLGDVLDLRSAAVTPAAVQAPSVVPITGVPAGDPPSARWAVSPSGAHIVLASSGDVAISTSMDDTWSAPVVLDVGLGEVQRIEDAAAQPDGAALAALVSADLDLVIARLAADGSIECAGAIDLPGEPVEASLFFTRALLAAGPNRWLAATSSGVFAIDTSASCPLAVTFDEAFAGDALRGPLTACAPPP